MKLTIDLDKLLEEGEINHAEYEKFSRLAARNTASLAFNILIAFGVIAVSGGALALVPTPVTAIAIGLGICAVGIAIKKANNVQWMLFANICVLVGALMFGGGIITTDEGSVRSFLIVAVAFVGAGIFSRSSLLVVLSVLALSSCLGARTGYIHATYFLGISEPTLTVVLFTIFSIGLYQLSKYLEADYQNMAITASRTGVFLVNFGFWVGSLWGDHKEGGEIFIPDEVFATLWAIALIAAGSWAWKRNRRWLVNIVAVFGAIHFYTQWFERLGASEVTVLVAGLLALGFAVWLRAMNARLRSEK